MATPGIELVNNPSPPNNPSQHGTDEISTPAPQRILNAEEYKTIVQNLSDRTRSLQNSAFTLASYYFISQTVVFTALSTTKSLVCRDFWLPLLLSLLPGALNLFAFFKIGQEYIETKISQNKFKESRARHEAHMSTGTHTIQIPGANNQEEIEKERLTGNLYRYMYAFGLLAAVVASGILWMLCWKSFYAFGPLAAVVALGSLWMLCWKSFIFLRRRMYTRLTSSSTMRNE